MEFPKLFVAATRETGGFEQHIPAPCLRKTFTLENVPHKADFLISGLGFYEAFINGTRITKGHMAPYISNSDHIVYFDRYEIASLLREGKNCVGVVLGNGMQNAFGGYVWDFDKTAFRSAPKAAFRLELDEDTAIESDVSVKTAPSPIVFNELRCGEFYDANKEIAGWNLPEFDDSAWENALIAENPRGERRICEADPILPQRELRTVSITEQDGGYLYDFGENCTGVTRLRIQGEPGQVVTIGHGEWMHRGKLDLHNFGHFYPEGYWQKTQYTCRGGEEEVYQPGFTYYGFQYALVQGVTKEQATPELLTYVVLNSNLAENGSFRCSDETANILQSMCRRSTLANFLYFPTDCPHREKNGWTGDASVSCEHTLLNLVPEKSYREWLHNIRKAMNEKGQLPGVVPTGDWGYHWGNGPCWDQVLTTLPYFTYLYRGDKAILEENATAIFRYLVYLDENLNKQGLIDFGLGDWVQVSREAHKPTAPVELTNSIMSMEIARMAAYIFGELGMENKRQFALRLQETLRANLRKYKIDLNTMTAAGNCQTSQAMAIYYDVFEPGEKRAAMDVLLKLIDEKDGKFDVGMLGFRVLFHLLSQFG
ncbi:MAG: family 78 glycoside hydrolase catalytic domain, partial [Oscillospiraceae bacterium]|nr:family 78 glycoside hydrolase catalytic domain [Oscillospiraceae bacterium]